MSNPTKEATFACITVAESQRVRGVPPKIIKGQSSNGTGLDIHRKEGIQDDPQALHPWCCIHSALLRVRSRIPGSCDSGTGPPSLKDSASASSVSANQSQPLMHCPKHLGWIQSVCPLTGQAGCLLHIGYRPAHTSRSPSEELYRC